MGEGGERENDLRVDLRTDRYIKLQYQGAGSRPWILERRNGLARGTYNRMKADGRYAGRQLLTEVKFWLNAMLATNVFSAYQIVFGSNPAENFWLVRRGRGSAFCAGYVTRWAIRCAMETPYVCPGGGVEGNCQQETAPQTAQELPTANCSE